MADTKKKTTPKKAPAKVRICNTLFRRVFMRGGEGCKMQCGREAVETRSYPISSTRDTFLMIFT